MTKLVWDQVGDRVYETGVDHGVLFPMASDGSYETGVPWNGLSAVTEKPSGAEPSPIYADNIKYLNLMSAEEFNASIEAYTYPDEFALCDGSAQPTPGVYVGQQTRKKFGLVYRTLIGNDVQGQDLGYKLHIVYGAQASPSEKGYNTVNDSPEAIAFSWELTTTPVEIAGYKPSACIIVDSTLVAATELAALEDLLFGDDAAGLSQLPDPATVISTLTSSG
jgi:hypothetical protein